MISLYLDDLLVSASYHYHQDMVDGWESQPLQDNFQMVQ